MPGTRPLTAASCCCFECKQPVGPTQSVFIWGPCRHRVHGHCFLEATTTGTFECGECGSADTLLDVGNDRSRREKALAFLKFQRTTVRSQILRQGQAPNLTDTECLKRWYSGSGYPRQSLLAEAVASCRLGEAACRQPEWCAHGLGVSDAAAYDRAVFALPSLDVRVWAPRAAKLIDVRVAPWDLKAIGWTAAKLAVCGITVDDLVARCYFFEDLIEHLDLTWASLIGLGFQPKKHLRLLSVTALVPDVLSAPRLLTHFRFTYADLMAWGLTIIELFALGFRRSDLSRLGLTADAFVAAAHSTPGLDSLGGPAWLAAAFHVTIPWLWALPGGRSYCTAAQIQKLGLE